VCAVTLAEEFYEWDPLGDYDEFYEAECVGEEGVGWVVLFFSPTVGFPTEWAVAFSGCF